MLSREDLAQLEAEGIPPEEARRQIRLFEHPPPHIRLDRACTVGDGIRRLSDADIEASTPRFDEACEKGRVAKFVPASGAASRMFQSLLATRTQSGTVHRDGVEKLARQGDRNAQELLAFMTGIQRFAFFDDLVGAMAVDGLDAVALIEEGQFRQVLDYLLAGQGLNYGSLPKGLIKFHRYPEESRTAFEEHLVEAAAYLRDARGVCRLNFTVSPEHEERFRAVLRAAGAMYERRSNVRFDVAFSTQKRSTDTMAVDLENRPFRERDGLILLRPGGHGALIENLNDLRADIVFIENIDNVVPDQLKDANVRWKKALGGHLLALQGPLFRHLEQLSSEQPSRAVVEDAIGFARDTVGISLPAGLSSASTAERRTFLVQKLNRPLRVCGMVRNVGEPGGGPFWVRGRDGTLSVQIVESAQVDPNDREQASLFASATHFNPVELACAVRDWRGQAFDLNRYVDWDAVFITRKSKDGRELKALERPGLWNGAMAEWTTVFVEIPNAMFNPVKTVNDLLRPEHQVSNCVCD